MHEIENVEEEIKRQGAIGIRCVVVGYLCLAIGFLAYLVHRNVNEDLGFWIFTGCWIGLIVSFFWGSRTMCRLHKLRRQSE